MNMAAAAVQNYPTGMRFHPTNLELVAYFLHDKAEVEKTGWYSDIIHECNDFYGDKEPWVIWEAYKSSTHEEGEPLYFYTKRIKQNSNGKRFARKVGTGTWSGEYSREVLTAEDGTKIGTMKNFRYEKGCDNDQNGAWLMQEYESDEFYQNGGNDYVICVLRKNPRKTPTDEITKKNSVKLGKRSKSDDVVAETEDDQSDKPTKRLKEEEISEVAKEETSNEQGCSSCTQLPEQWHHQDQGTGSYYYPAENSYFPELFGSDYDDGVTIEQLFGPITDEYYKSIPFQDQLDRGGDDNSNIGDYWNGGLSQLLNDQPSVDYLANI